VVFNYVVTFNHIHLVVPAEDDSETIPKSIQLLAGRTGQEYNRRKNVLFDYIENGLKRHYLTVECNERDAGHKA
jgi:hypothetical protein